MNHPTCILVHYTTTLIVIEGEELTMHKATATVVNISASFDDYFNYYHHQQHQQQPQQQQQLQGDHDDDDGNDEPFYEFIKQPLHLVVIYTLAYAAVFLLAVVGNVLVICVVCRNSSIVASAINFYSLIRISDVII